MAAGTEKGAVWEQYSPHLWMRAGWLVFRANAWDTWRVVRPDHSLCKAGIKDVEEAKQNAEIDMMGRI